MRSIAVEAPNDTEQRTKWNSDLSGVRAEIHGRRTLRRLVPSNTINPERRAWDGFRSAALRRCLSIIIIAPTLYGVAPRAMAQDGNDPSLAAPATEETIDELVKALSDPVYQRRTYAARRLAAIGMPAAQRLRAAVRKADAETALRAQRILAALDKRFLAGVEVRLQFSHSAIAWETPTNLSLTISNPTPYPSRIPFDIRAPQQSGDAEAPREAAMIDEDHARQVGDMLDLADLIQVRDAEGQLIDVAIDETGDDPAVDNAVRERSSGNGPEYTLQPGERITLTARNFNRGWARYPLLDAGVYTVVFDFVPDWDDPVLAAERIGRIVSNQATLTVTEAAPEAVSRKGAKAMIALRRDGSFLTVSLTNRSDLPAYVNTNFGATLPFAEGVWVYEEDGVRREVRVDQKPTSSWRDFEAERLRRVSPGDAVELARVDVADLQRALEEVGVNLQGKAASVHFRYMNLCDRHWQEKQASTLQSDHDVPPVLKDPLPRRMLVARYNSNQLPLP